MSEHLKRFELSDEELDKVNGGLYSGGTAEYTVQAGDTLSTIAMRYSTTIAILMELNAGKEGFNPPMLSVGQTIIVPIH